MRPKDTDLIVVILSLFQHDVRNIMLLNRKHFINLLGVVGQCRISSRYSLKQHNSFCRLLYNIQELCLMALIVA